MATAKECAAARGVDLLLSAYAPKGVLYVFEDCCCAVRAQEVIETIFMYPGKLKNSGSMRAAGPFIPSDLKITPPTSIGTIERAPTPGTWPQNCVRPFGCMRPACKVEGRCRMDPAHPRFAAEPRANDPIPCAFCGGLFCLGAAGGPCDKTPAPHLKPSGLTTTLPLTGDPTSALGAACYVCDDPCPPASATGREVPLCARHADEEKTPPMEAPPRGRGCTAPPMPDGGCPPRCFTHGHCGGGAELLPTSPAGRLQFAMDMLGGVPIRDEGGNLTGELTEPLITKEDFAKLVDLPSLPEEA